MPDFSDWIRRTGLANIIWITDVDETLLEKSSNPNNVTQIPGLESLCEKLDARAGGGFYVITGRDLPWLDKVFPARRIRASCEYHCLFRREPDEPPEILNPVPEWSLIDEEMESLAVRHEGLLLRKKPFMRSLHYIAVPEEKREAVKAAIEPKLKALLDRHNAQTGQAVGMVDGGKVFDMGPSNSDKSHAFIDILRHAEAKTGKKLTPVYFGDSPGDLPAARTAQENGGKFIAVGNDPRVTSVADFMLESPAAYRALIKDVIGLQPGRGCFSAPGPFPSQ
ncbi:MAG: HAD-IIB family hydrolase [Proteobacteria bacterium]|nr:HAD-IIB family hydrolase [Pseudomonadota bacterium]